MAKPKIQSTKQESRVTIKLPIGYEEWAPIYGELKKHRIDAGPKALQCLRDVYAELLANSEKLPTKES